MIARCLERDRKKRLQAIGEARIAIEEAIAKPTDEDFPHAAPAPVQTRANAGWIMSTFLLVALAVAGAGWWRASLPQAKEVWRFAWLPPAGHTLAVRSSGAVAISRDGQWIAGTFAEQGVTRIFVRRADSFEATFLPGTEEATHPFFSPDGQWIAFFAGNQLKKTRVLGGGTTLLTEAGEDRGAAWGNDGTIVFTPTATSPLMQFSEGGGAPKPITTLDPSKNERTHRWPHFMPDGKSVLFTVGSVDSPENYDSARIEAVILATGERRVVLEGAAWAQYSPDSRQLLFVRESTLFAVPFDASALRVQGAGVPIVQGVLGDSTTGVAYAGISDTGTLVYVPGGAVNSERVFVWVDRNGKEESLKSPPRHYVEPTISPDGTKIASGILGGRNTEIWIYDIQRQTLTKLTFGNNSIAPLWTLDSKSVIYLEEVMNDKTRTGGLMIKAADGSTEAVKLIDTRSATYPSSLSPDGKVLLCDITRTGNRSDVVALQLQAQGERKLQDLITTQADEFLPRLSPDGRWLAYQSTESGRDEIYVKAFPSLSGRWQISNAGGGEPTWSPDGRELFYRRQNDLMVVDVDTRDGFKAGTPRALIRDFGFSSGGRNGVSYGVAPDGKRFFRVRPVREEALTSQVNVVVNWTSEIRRGAFAPK